MSEPLKIAIAGLGTVGAGVMKVIAANGDMLSQRGGRPLELHRKVAAVVVDAHVAQQARVDVGVALERIVQSP